MHLLPFRLKQGEDTIMSPFQEEERMCKENKNMLSTDSLGRQSPPESMEPGQHRQQQQQQQRPPQRQNSMDANGGLHGGGNDGNVNNNTTNTTTTTTRRAGRVRHRGSAGHQGGFSSNSSSDNASSSSHSRSSKKSNAMNNNNNNGGGSSLGGQQQQQRHNTITNINKINVINNFGMGGGNYFSAAAAAATPSWNNDRNKHQNNNRQQSRERLGWFVLRAALAFLIVVWLGAMATVLKNGLPPANGGGVGDAVGVGSKAAVNLPRWKELSEHIKIGVRGKQKLQSQTTTGVDETTTTTTAIGESSPDREMSGDANDFMSNDDGREQQAAADPSSASMWELSMFGNAKPSDFQLYSPPTAPGCSKPLDAENVSFTLVSQLSGDRVWMVRYHCERWGKDNPMSIVVFTDRTAADVKAELVSGGQCSDEKLTVQTVSKTKYDPTGTEYPVNMLRNMALGAVRTSHIVYADVDFWPAADLHSVLSAADVKERFASDPKLATVVPVFQMYRRCKEYKDCRATNVPAMPKTKKGLLTLIRKKQASTFDPTNVGGHGSTKYITWRDQEGGTFVDLPCVKSNRYEPYLAFRYCGDLPPFQEGFTGYGKNKMTWVMQLRRAGYLFSQLGGAFLVHYPHLDSKARLEWNKKPKAMENHQPLDQVDGAKDIDWGSYKRARVDALFLDFKEWLDGTVEDESRVPMCEDALNDDVRLWVHPAKQRSDDDEGEFEEDVEDSEEGDEEEEDEEEEEEEDSEDSEDKGEGYGYEDYEASKAAYDECQAEQQSDNPSECLEVASDFIESSIIWSIAGRESGEFDSDKQMTYLYEAEQCATEVLALQQKQQQDEDYSFKNLVADLYVTMGAVEKNRIEGRDASMKAATNFVEKALALNPNAEEALKMSRQLQQGEGGDANNEVSEDAQSTGEQIITGEIASDVNVEESAE